MRPDVFMADDAFVAPTHGLVRQPTVHERAILLLDVRIGRDGRNVAQGANELRESGGRRLQRRPVFVATFDDGRLRFAITHLEVGDGQRPPQHVFGRE